jgi:uncharacterized protein YlzI (FlbEa/FlbD family)
VILLTKLDKQKVLVLIDSIKYVEATPDTLIRFINGDMLIVSESLQQVSDLVFGFKTKCLAGASISTASVETSSGDCASWT